MPLIEPVDVGIDLLYGKSGPTEKQILFRDDPSRYKLYGGAVGGGKSWSLSAEGIRLSLAYPGNRGFMCRHEATAFKMTTLNTLLKLIKEIEDVTHSKLMSNHHRTDKILYFLNGSTIMYGALGDIQDFERIKSLEIGWFAIDEASETPYPNYQMLKSRLRWKLPDGSYPPFFGLLASNPEPGWVKDLFVVSAKVGELPPNHSFIPALPKDNPFLPATYLADLRASNPANWVERYIEGSWSALEGQIWPEFDENIHLIKPFEVPASWTHFYSIDHGQVHPTCCLWFAVDQDGNIFVYNEYYQPGIVSQHCNSINRLSQQDLDKGAFHDYVVLPPECWGKTREKAGRLWSIYDEYVENGISPIKANNEVLAGLNRVGEYFKIDANRISPITGEKPSPRLFIFDTCKNLIKEIFDYVWKPQKGEETVKEAPKKVRDDAVDALRYGIMTRPSPTEMKKVENPNSFNGWKRRMLSINRKYGYIGEAIY